MVKLKDLEKYLSSLLDTTAYEDYCVNGIQVEGRETVKQIITGVSASARLFEVAVAHKADAVIVHHGLFWKNSPHPMVLTGPLKNRVKLLMDKNINLLAYHHPLDGHKVFGNNALIAKKLKLTDTTFCPISGMDQPMAAVGNFLNPIPFKQFLSYADRVLKTSGLGLDFSNGEVQRVFVLSGGGSGFYSDAAAVGADLMVTGELKEDVVRSAEESGISLYAAGHYNSEKWGVIALGKHLCKEFKLEVEFIDIPNPV